MAGAMVSASTGVMNSLLGKLSALLEKEYAKYKNFKSDVQFLRNELSSMSAVLQKYSMLEEPDVQVKVWMKEVRELAYDIEDCIDTFMIHAEHQPDEPSGIKGFVRKNIRKVKKLASHLKIANEIQELKKLVVDASERRARYKLDETLSITSDVTIDPRIPAFYAEASGLVGIDPPTDKIIHMLMEEQGGSVLAQQLKVVSIVGFGGLGKTTLANQVYHKIKGEFDCTAIVSLSQRPNVKKILKDILHMVEDNPSGAGKAKQKLDDELHIIHLIRKFLQEKRYLIIVDDIWSTQAWEVVKSALPDNSFCSRIITTTRIIGVAKSCCSSLHDQVYNIEPLSDEDSRRLFFKRIYHSECSCPPHLEEVSHTILNKCGGLPLAILTIASMLSSKSDTKDEWELVQNSLGSALEKHHNMEGMKKILLLSYYDLPHHLKTCLLYLSIFPEDYEIGREELTWRWIAEGFIAEERGKRLDQVADSYFNELINRSMIQPVGIQYDGKAQCCRVHDFVLNIIVSLSTEENFVTITDGIESTSLPNKIRRLSLQSNNLDDEIMHTTIRDQSHVRSLIVCGFPKQVPHLLNFHALRLLDLYSCSFLEKHHVECIGSMLQLRYLNLCFTNITELPEQIGDLQHLEVLDVRVYPIAKLPKSIVRLKKLVRLYVDWVKLPDEIGKLHALEALSSICIPCNSVKSVEQLGCLTKLRELEISVDYHEMLSVERMCRERYRQKLISSLRELGRHNLQNLYIYYPGEEKFILDSLMDSCCALPHLRELVISNYISVVPKWMNMLVNLVHLKLWITKMGERDIRVLEDISTLLFLGLDLSCAPDERLVVGSQGFQCLKAFELSCSSCGMGLVFAPGSMPKLEILHLEFSSRETNSKYGDFNFGIQYLASLQHGYLEICHGGETDEEMDAVEAAIRETSSGDLNNPTLVINILE